MGRNGAQQYLSVPIATKMAAENPKLWEEFSAKVQSDEKFAADADARIQWWTSKSNYQPSAVNRYPVLEVWEKTW